VSSCTGQSRSLAFEVCGVYCLVFDGKTKRSNYTNPDGPSRATGDLQCGEFAVGGVGSRALPASGLLCRGPTSVRCWGAASAVYAPASGPCFDRSLSRRRFNARRGPSPTHATGCRPWALLHMAMLDGACICDAATSPASQHAAGLLVAGAGGVAFEGGLSAFRHVDR
jgi:hypothetical protein